MSRARGDGRTARLIYHTSPTVYINITSITFSSTTLGCRQRGNSMVLDVDRGTTALTFEDRAGAVWLFFVVEDVEV